MWSALRGVWFSFREVLRSRPARWIFAAGGARYVGGLSIASFLVRYFEAAFPGTSSRYSVANALVVSLGGALASIAGGWLSDRVAARSHPRARAYVIVVSALLAIGPMAGVLFLPSFDGAMGMLFLEYLLAETWFGPTLSLLQHCLPRRIIGAATALFAFVCFLVGSAAPPALGLLYDALEDKAAIRWPLFLFIAVSYVVGSLCFLIAACHVPLESADAVEDRERALRIVQQRTIPEERSRLLFSES